MKFAFLLLFTFILHESFADSSRTRFSFKSKNGLFELKPSDTLFSDNKVYTDSIYNSHTKSYFVSTYRHTDRYYWGLYDTRTNTKLYTIKNDSLLIEFKTALISETGERIVIVDDYSGGLAISFFEVVHFYKEGRLVKALKLGEILNSLCATIFSASHMHWCSSFSLEEPNKFKIKTNDLYHQTYSLDGELLENTSDGRIWSKDNIISADIKRIKRSAYQLLVTKSIRGSLKVGEIINIECPDRKMKKILGAYRSVFPYRTEELKKGFHARVHLRENKVILKTYLPFYNAPDYCNYDWGTNKNSR